MLVPTEETTLSGDAATYPEDIPGYGERGWCRAEYFIFSLWAEMQEDVSAVQLYALTVTGNVHQYPSVKVIGAQYMPSGGELTVVSDRELIQQLEDQMIAAYGVAVAVKACRAGGEVDLSNKMLRAGAIGAPLEDALRRHNVTSLSLHTNQLKSEGAAKLAPIIVNASLTQVLAFLLAHPMLLNHMAITHSY